MSESSSEPATPLSGTEHGFLDALCSAIPAKTDYAILGFDVHLHCCYASGPGLGALGIENPPRGTGLQTLAPALRTVVSGLCRCVFAGALTETEITHGSRRLRLNGLPLLDSNGAISMALIRILPAEPASGARRDTATGFRQRGCDEATDWHGPAGALRQDAAHRR